LTIIVIHPNLPNNLGYNGKFMSSLESGQPSGALEHEKPAARPLAVTLGVAWLTANFLMAFVSCLVSGFREASPFPPPGTNILWALFLLWPFFFVLFLLVLLSIPLWFLYRQKNWARWYFLVLIGFSLAIFFTNAKVTLISAGIVLMDVVAIVALFLPSSNRWFHARTKAPPPLPT
jgi:hypothetical protein